MDGEVMIGGGGGPKGGSVWRGPGADQFWEQYFQKHTVEDRKGEGGNE